jgi:coproporphyrinogen III oxidase-like Fe-S oxidoreductase
VRTPDRYIARIQGGESPLGGEEFLDESTQRFEEESLALRTARGVALEAFDSLEEIQHLVRVREGRVTLRPKARLVANQVIVRLKSSESSGNLL